MLSWTILLIAEIICMNSMYWKFGKNGKVYINHISVSGSLINI